MIQYGEIIIFLIGIVTLIFILKNRLQLITNLPSAKILITGFSLLLGGWVFTIVEGLLWKNFLNVLEHICYTSSSIAIAVWCWKAFKKDREA